MEIQEEAPDVFSLQLFSPAECAALLAAAAKEVTWASALVYTPQDRFENRERRRCSEQELASLPGLSRSIEAGLGRAVAAARLCWRWPLTAAADTRLVRYETGDFIGSHVDYYLGCGRPPRLVSVVCYLNDDYGGGETIFPRQRHTVKPRAGKAILFPSDISHPHEGAVVTSGTRYVLVSWIA